MSTSMNRSRSFDLCVVLVLVIGAMIEVGPIYLALTTASHSAEFLARHHVPLTIGDHLRTSLVQAWRGAALGRKIFNSIVVCVIVTVLKLTLAVTTAFSMTYFRTPLRTLGFALIFLTLMLPLEVRIAPTYSLAADVLAPLHAIVGLFGIDFSGHLTLLDSYLGLSLPVAATATGTFLFRQFFSTLPDVLVDAAKVDGIGPMRFLFHILLPLSHRNIVALAIVTFVSTWNQYLWPLLITTRTDMETAVLAIRTLTPDPQNPEPAWNIALAGVLIIGFLPVLVTALFQREFADGLFAGKGR